MRYKILLAGCVALLGACAFGQDINRASDWHIKRAEQPQAKVEKELGHNGTYAVKGSAPAVTDEVGNPIARRPRAHAQISEDTAVENSSVASASEPSTAAKDEFAAANEAVIADVKDQPKPFLVGGVFLALAAAFVVGLRLMAGKIKIPEGALE